MNRKVKKFISSGAIALCLVTSGGINSFASEISEYNESKVILEEALENPTEENLVLEDGKVYKDGEEIAGVTYTSELVGVDVEGDEELISLGLLDKDYKEQMLNSETRGSENIAARGSKNITARGSKNISVWYEHPYTFETKVTFKLNFIKTMGTTTIKSKVTAGYISSTKSKKLKVAITSTGKMKNTSPFKTTFGKISSGSYVTKGNTSASSFKSTHRDTSGKYKNITPTTAKVKAKFNHLLEGTSQVGFGIDATITV